jgi:diaminopimelate decarboxylase
MGHEVFHHRDAELFCEECSLVTVACAVATPFYVYSLTCIRERFRAFDRGFSGVPHLICYALKANSQPALLRVLLDEGAGAEVVSGAELHLALAVGFEAEKIVFSGVGKTEAELEAGLRAGVFLFTVESEGELALLNRLALGLGRRQSVGLRINPDIDPETHPHIATGVQTAKFGLDPEAALELYMRRQEFPGLDFTAVHTHLGSQLTSIEPLGEAARMLEKLAGDLKARGKTLTDVNWGGGLGIDYGEEKPPGFEEYAEQILPWISRSGARLILEPGRALVGPAGALIVRVLYVKTVHGSRFAVVDGGMNDLLRPALYNAYHRIVPLNMKEGKGERIDVVGAVCESSDVFGRCRDLGDVRPGDYLAILDTGAYGYSMSFNYNLRPRPAEIVVEGGKYRVVRKAETAEALVARELGEEKSI